VLAIDGYTIAQVAHILPDPGKPRDDAHIIEGSLKRQPKLSDGAVAVANGATMVGACLPHPHMKDVKGLMVSNIKRIMGEHPKPDMSLIDELRSHVREEMRKYKPLGRDKDFDVEAWLEQTNYTMDQKREIRADYAECLGRVVEARGRMNNVFPQCFQKDEYYDTFKYYRSIFARPNAFKAMAGPLFKHIEKEVFSDPHFIKKIPRTQWAREIRDAVIRTGRIYVSTDYSAFESQFRDWVMRAVEFELYMYMTQNTPGYIAFLELLTIIAGRQRCQFKWFDVVVIACRMSGEMCTSLGNGFSNLMFFSFVMKKCNIKDWDGRFEGDDGIAGLTYPSDPMDIMWFKRLGLTIKLQVHRKLATASFCGQVFDELELISIADPIKLLLKLGWSDVRYLFARDSKKKALAKAKAMSLLYQYAGCPVITQACLWVLRATKRIDVRSAWRGLSDYDRTLAIEACDHLGEALEIANREVGRATRLLCTELYQISVLDQMRLEKEFCEMVELRPYDCSRFEHLVPQDAKLFFKNYARVIDSRDRTSSWYKDRMVTAA